MKQSYKIKGMTCKGCQRHVEKELSKIKEVQEVRVDLEGEWAEISSVSPITLQELQQALSRSQGNYQILEGDDTEASMVGELKEVYQVAGMTCNGCRTHVEEALRGVEGVERAKVDLDSGSAEVVFRKAIPVGKLQQALEDLPGNYTIHLRGEDPKILKESPRAPGTGVFYCPMHCEGEKTYSAPGDCPVCGMDLVEEVNLSARKAQYTCPMHPEIIRDQPGDCPICGMDLVPIQPVSSEDRNYKKLLRKLKFAVAFTIPILIIAMSELVSGNPLYDLMDLYRWNWVQFGLSLPVVFYATWMFFERAWRSIVTMKLNMFTLIGIGAGLAWLFSIFGLLFPAFFPEQFKTHMGTVHVYFEAATVILSLVLLGQVLEARAHTKTNSAIKELLKLAPNKAIKVIDGQEHEVPIDQIKEGDLLRVKPGDKVPVDGIIQEGNSTIDESMITGEPIPVDKSAGDKVTSGTINGNRSFTMTAEKVGDQTLLAQIIQMVNEASRSQAPIQKLADRIAAYFVPVVVLIAVLTFVVWAVYGPEPSYVYALVNAIAVLIIACPCALGLATPMSVMVGVGKGAGSGVLIKNARALEQMNKMDILIIDKTGTITQGRPGVEKVEVVSGENRNEVISHIAAVNARSEHPLAKANVEFAREQNMEIKEASDFESITGMGVVGMVGGNKVVIGNEKLLQEEELKMASGLSEKVSAERGQGKTVSYVGINGRVVGYLTITDPIKRTSREALQALMADGLEVYMYTGDNQQTAAAVAGELGLSGFQAGMLPGDKLKGVEKLQKEGKKVAMAGDGINDAPALAKADIGIAMGTGTDVAIESAEITLVKGDLMAVKKARNLSRKVMRNIKQNLFFAMIYNTLGVPIAAGVLYPVFGLLLSPMIAALAMSLSSLSVISNALRLKGAKI